MISARLRVAQLLAENEAADPLPHSHPLDEPKVAYNPFNRFSFHYLGRIFRVQIITCALYRTIDMFFFFNLFLRGTKIGG